MGPAAPAGEVGATLSSGLAGGRGAGGGEGRATARSLRAASVQGELRGFAVAAAAGGGG